MAAHRSRESHAQIDVLEADLAELERGSCWRFVRLAQRWCGPRAASRRRAPEGAAEQAYASRSSELSVGGAGTADVFAPESDLTRARLDALDAAVEQRIARARLTYAVGDLGPVTAA